MNISKEVVISGSLGLLGLAVLVIIGLNSGLVGYLFRGKALEDDQITIDSQPTTTVFGNLLADCKFAYPIVCDGKTSFVRDGTFISSVGGNNPLSTMYYQILAPDDASDSATESTVTRTGPALLFYVATEEEINPYILLTLLELDTGFVLGDATAANYPTMEGVEFYNYLTTMATELRAFYDKRQTEGTSELSSFYAKSAGKSYPLPSSTTAASLAILDYLDTRANSSIEFEKFSDPQAGFLNLYRRLSQDDPISNKFSSPTAY